MLASTYGIGAGPGTGVHGSRLTCTRLVSNQGTATVNKIPPRGEGTLGTQAGVAKDTGHHVIVLPSFEVKEGIEEKRALLAKLLFIKCM